jgi:CheY-like chemotaxis protein/Tfp pilus assembly protein PilF
MRIPFEKKSYLIVDDFGDMRSMLRSMLSMFGVTKVDTASNGKEAVQYLERGKYDIVLCDYNLGQGKDGQQVLEEARQRSLISLSTVFIMITAENTREMVLGAIEYEPDSYLSKPFTKDLLRNRLEKILAKKQDLEAVDQAVERKDFTRAIALLDRRIAQRPKNLAELTRLKADLCLRAEHYKSAAAIYERVLAIREIPWARLGLGRVFFHRKQYEEAREIFQDLVNNNERMTVAYDWLARTHTALGDRDGAQEVLSSAVEMSPKAILRQRALGEAAFRNQDYVVAEQAFKQTVNQGKYSVFKHPAPYARLAESVLANDQHKNKKDAVGVIKQIDRDFGRDNEAQLYAVMSEVLIHAHEQDAEAMKKSMARADQLYERLGVHGKPELTLAMARTAAQADERERAEQLFHQAVRNNHDDDEFLRSLEADYLAAGLPGDPSELIASIKKEIVELNNKGVKLAGSGQIEQAIGLFEEAAEGMAENKVINLNTAKVLILHMERQGADADSMSKARKYIERVRKLDPEDAGLAKVLEKFQAVVAKH